MERLLLLVLISEMSTASLSFNLDEVSRSLSSRRLALNHTHLQEVRLANSNADRERIEELANLFALIRSLEYLERAYVRDSITASQCVLSLFRLPAEVTVCSCGGTLFTASRYAPACTKILAQYKTIMKLVGDHVPSLEAFMQEYRARFFLFFPFLPHSLFLAQMDCTAAAHRLRVGVPATVEHAAEEQGASGAEMAKQVAETTQVRPPLPSFLLYLTSVSLLPGSHRSPPAELHHLHGRPQAQTPRQGPAASAPDRPDERLHPLQEQQRVGGTTEDLALVRSRRQSFAYLTACSESKARSRRSPCSRFRLVGSSLSTRCEQATRLRRSSLDRYALSPLFPSRLAFLPLLPRLLADALRRRARLLRVRLSRLFFAP